MTASIGRWFLVAGFGGCLFAASACELIVGGGDYRTGGDGGSSSGAGGSGAGGSGASSGGGSGGASGSGAGASGASSGAASGAGSPDVDSGGGVTAFVGTWTGSVTQVTQCTDGSVTSAPQTTQYADTVTWTQSSSTTVTAPANNADPCAAQASVADSTVSVTRTSCSVEDTTNSVSLSIDVTSDTWTLDASGGTATVSESLMTSETLSGTFVTCNVTITGTYAKN